MLRNAVLEAIFARRSTRQFEPRQIEPEVLDTLLEAAIWAPSGGNSQSWLFTAIQHAPTLVRVSQLTREALRRWTPDDDYPAKHTAKARASQESYHFFYHAPTLVIASNRPGYANAIADCALALENMFLAAQSLQVGSCYINQLHWLTDDAPLRDYLFELGIPREHVICSSAALGYIARASAPPPRKAGTVRIIR
jgi:nitroreductase